MPFNDVYGELDEVQIMLDDGAYPVVRAHAEDAGLDLRTPVDVTIPVGKGVAIDTGVHILIPRGFYGKLESKSGLNVKHSIVSLGGTIDANYAGSIVAKLYNFGSEDYTFHAGDKIVQLVIQTCENPRLVLVNKFPETDRGANGFGSSGK